MNVQAEKTSYLGNKIETHVNVLLVDDKLENLITLETLLKKENDSINYMLCRSGEAALKLAIKEEIALILLDVQMPEMDGFEVAKMLKNNSRTSTIPIIFVTAIDRETEEVVQGLESGAVDFLFKPLNPSITKAKVNAFIRLYLQNKEIHQKNRLLKEKQQIITETQELAGISTWEWNLSTRQVCFSAPLASLLEMEPDKDIPAERFLSLVHPADHDKIQAMLQAATRSNDYIWYDYRLVTQGKTLYFAGKVKAERDESGQPFKLTGYSQNVTPLRESLALLERIFHVSPNAICTCTVLRNEAGAIVDFTIVRVNKAIEQMAGRATEEILGKRLLQVFPGIKANGLFDKFIEVTERNTVVNTEHFYQYKETRTWLHILAAKLDDGIVMTLGDITQRKKSEVKLTKAHAELAMAHQALLQLNNELENRVKDRTRELEQAERDLRKMNKNLLRINAELDSFVYTASHDLKAPINNIEGLVTHLKKYLPADNEKVNQLTAMIEDSIIRFKNILKELTEMLKLENFNAEDIEQVALEPLIEEVKLNIKQQIESSDATITTRLDIPEIQFSKKNLRSILHNLISNAIKYRSPERKPEVLITTHYSEDKHLVLSVQDNGLGVKKEEIPKMFDMFKRLHKHVEGSGIGLYIVRKIVENNEGSVEVESEYGKGTTVRIFFKVAS